jgi:hypothetical protein
MAYIQVDAFSPADCYPLPLLSVVFHIYCYDYISTTRMKAGQDLGSEFRKKKLLLTTISTGLSTRRRCPMSGTGSSRSLFPVIIGDSKGKKDFR